MSKYYVPVVWSLMGHIEVEANTPEEAVKSAEKEILTCPLPENGAYLEDSMEVDYEGEPSTTPPLSWVTSDPIVLSVPTEAELFVDGEDNDALAKFTTDALVVELTRRGWEPDRMSVPLPFERKLVVNRGSDPEYPEFYTSVFDKDGAELQLALIGKQLPMSEEPDDADLRLLYWTHVNQFDDGDEAYKWKAENIETYLGKCKDAGKKEDKHG